MGLRYEQFERQKESNYKKLETLNGFLKSERKKYGIDYTKLHKILFGPEHLLNWH